MKEEIKEGQNLRSSLINGGLWALGGKIISIACAFVTNLILARVLSPSEYGIYFVLLNTMIILATVGTMGMDQVVVRFVAACKARDDGEGIRRVVYQCLGIVLAGTVLVCVIFYMVAPFAFTHILKMPSAVSLLVLVALWLFVSSVQRQLAETCRGLNDIRLATLFGGLRNNGIIISTTTCALVLLAWLQGWLNLSSAISISACCSILVIGIALVTLWRYLRRFIGYTPADNAVIHLGLRRMMTEGWPLWLAVLVMVLRAQSGAWFAGMFDVSDKVALYGIAQRFVLLLTAPLVIVNAILPPVIADLYARGEVRRMGTIVQVVGGLVCIPGAIALVVLILFGHTLLALLFGHFYMAAYPLLIILCVGQMANIVTGAWQIVLPMTGNRQQMLRVSLVAAIAQVISSVIGGYVAGVLGVAIGACLGLIVANVYGLLSVRRHLGVWIYVTIRASVVRDTVEIFRGRFRRRAA